MPIINTDVCVIGAGSGGLTVAVGAAQMGAKVVLIEANKMGGECLNTGCVPSKAFINAAHIADIVRNSKSFGIDVANYKVDYAEVHKYVKQIIANVAPHDSVDRMHKLGIKVLPGSAKFIDKDFVVVANTTVKARYFVIATGSSPVAPKIPGIENIPYLTNENIFSLDKKPAHLIVLGGGPIGCELAQAYRLLGTKVSLIQHSTILKGTSRNRD